MILLTPELHAALRANATAHHDAEPSGADEPDPAPVVKFFNPVGAATWLAIELDADGDTLFGLADLGFGCPELGSFSLSEIEQLRLPFGLAIERDLFFDTTVTLSVWADTARRAESIPAGETILCAARAARDPLPPPEPGDG